MKTLWHTRWQGQLIAVYRDDMEVDRIEAQEIERVFLLYRNAGESPGDVVQVVVELGTDALLFGTATGFASRVNFERQGFWTERRCVHWISQARAPLPLRLRTGSGLLHLSPPVFARFPKAQLSAAVARWPIKGPQTWDERKRQKIERSQPFSLEHA